MSWEEVKLRLSDDVRQKLDERHVLEDEIKQVIYQAEESGEKLFRPDKDIYLSKQRIGNATFYVEYTAEDGGYTVNTAYGHKAELME